MKQEIKSLLVNADRFLMSTGQRSYFYDQKNYYLSEIERLTQLYQKAYFKKREYKKKFTEIDVNFDKHKKLMEEEINYLRERVITIIINLIDWLR